MTEGLEEQVIGAVTVLYGERRGKYPHGNSLVVRGPEESAIIDPSLGVVARLPEIPRVDRVLNSHCHEDHFAGNYLFPDLPWHLHEADVIGMRSIEDLLAIYGYGAAIESEFRTQLLNEFHFVPRPGAVPFRDGTCFELGGAVRVRVLHAPGHTRGHCFFWIEPEDILYLADVDLSSFGPYYGDAWSDLADFEHTLGELRGLRPRYWATFHHIGVLEDRALFEDRYRRFCAVIADREARLLAFLREQPRSLEHIIRRRFVYRPGDQVLFADAVEARSMGQHVHRLLESGEVREVEPGLYFATR